MTELVRFLVESLVDQPDQVDIREVPGQGETVIEVRVAPQDTGKIIGKNGKIAKAIRTVVKAACTDKKKQYYVKII